MILSILLGCSEPSMPSPIMFAFLVMSMACNEWAPGNLHENVTHRHKRQDCVVVCLESAVCAFALIIQHIRQTGMVPEYIHDEAAELHQPHHHCTEHDPCLS